MAGASVRKEFDMVAKKSRGFSASAQKLIIQQPGLTAKEIVTRLLTSGEATSYAQNPVGSLIATLQKHYTDIGVDRRREGGIYRFYPNSITNAEDHSGSNQPSQPLSTVVSAPPQPPRPPSTDNQPGQPSGTDEIEVTVRLSRVIVDIIDNAVASGRYKQRNEAIQRLLQRGIGAGV